MKVRFALRFLGRNTKLPVAESCAESRGDRKQLLGSIITTKPVFRQLQFFRYQPPLTVILRKE